MKTTWPMRPANSTLPVRITAAAEAADTPPPKRAARAAAPSTPGTPPRRGAPRRPPAPTTASADRKMPAASARMAARTKEDRGTGARASLWKYPEVMSRLRAWADPEEEANTRDTTPIGRR